MDEKEISLLREFASFSGRVDAKLDRAIADIAILMETMKNIDEKKTDKVITIDIDRRLRRLERSAAIATGALLILQFALR